MWEQNNLGLEDSWWGTGSWRKLNTELWSCPAVRDTHIRRFQFSWPAIRLLVHTSSWMRGIYWHLPEPRKSVSRKFSRENYPKIAFVASWCLQLSTPGVRRNILLKMREKKRRLELKNVLEKRFELFSLDLFFAQSCYFFKKYASKSNAQYSAPCEGRSSEGVRRVRVTQIKLWTKQQHRSK